MLRLIVIAFLIRYLDTLNALSFEGGLIDQLRQFGKLVVELGYFIFCRRIPTRKVFNILVKKFIN